MQDGSSNRASEPSGGSYTALVMAGTRPGGDPMARAAGVSHKCLLPLNGRPMILHVLEALSRAPSIGSIAISIDRPAVLEDLELDPARIRVLHCGETPSLSALKAVEELDPRLPLLITTADHPLLQPELIEAFCRNVEAGGADISAGLAPASVIRAAFPDSKRTYLKLSDGQFSGCNLFAVSRARGLGAVRLWRRVERDRKRPWRIAKAFGLGMLLRYLSGRLSLEAALARISALAEANAGAVILSVAEAAVDVDKPEDLALVEAILQKRSLEQPEPDWTRVASSTYLN